MRTPSSRYCSIASAGSTTIAAPASGSPTRYEAHPRSSSTNCRKSSTVPEPIPSGGRRPEPHIDADEERDEREGRGAYADPHRRLAERARSGVLRLRGDDVDRHPVGRRRPCPVADEDVERDRPCLVGGGAADGERRELLLRDVAAGPRDRVAGPGLGPA